MSISQVQEALKNMSGDELAQVQNAIILASDSHMGCWSWSSCIGFRTARKDS